jgi:hypothetical protein
MYPLKLIIPGEYWDTQIYAGRLYLFERAGSIRTLDWDRLIGTWGIAEDSRIAMECAFQRSDYLYGDRWSLLFSDREFKELVRTKFERLSATDLTASIEKLVAATVGTQDSPFPFPHADSLIYKKNLFVVATEGVFRATCNKQTKRPVATRAEKKWDGPAQAVAASYNTLALAVGDEGLFQLPLDRNGGRPLRLEHQNCTDCSWTFQSIFCSSHLNSGYLAAFEKEYEDEYEDAFRRKFDGTIAAEDIFRSSGYSWGHQDKLCQAVDRRISIVRYVPWEKDREARLKALGLIDLAIHPGAEVIDLAPWKGDVISANVAVFGTIIECENAIVVVPSDGPVLTLPGEPVNWRIFPRSVQYENQLHAVYHDRLEILSFNQDYFVDQERKLSGIRHTDRAGGFSRPRKALPPPRDLL